MKHSSTLETSTPRPLRAGTGIYQSPYHQRMPLTALYCSERWPYWPFTLNFTPAKMNSSHVVVRAAGLARSEIEFNSSGIWSKKSSAIVMDHVIGLGGNPDFGFPSDELRAAAVGRAIWKGGEEDQVFPGRSEVCFEFRPAGLVHVAGLGRCINKEQPVALLVMNDYIGSRERFERRDAH
ncbi:MAG: hypothetical protein ABI600_00180 [Luteolibacter sp.]